MTRSAVPRLTDVNDAKALTAYLRLALTEDGAWDDVTSDSVVPVRAKGRARIFAKCDGLFCGGAIAERVFLIRNPRLRIVRKTKEGGTVAPDVTVMTIEGSLRSILAAERVALNFIQHLSGVATLTRQFVLAVGRRKVDILDTRKTTPLWRALERHAVRCGGGRNHRFALDDMVLLKNNHADAVGGVGRAVELARRKTNGLKIAAEARTTAEAKEAAEAGADIILLDNMNPLQMRHAIKAVAKRALIEVTGGVTLRNAAALARIGVDRLSAGALTHSAPAMDFSLHLTETSKPTRRVTQTKS